MGSLGILVAISVSSFLDPGTSLPGFPDNVKG